MRILFITILSISFQLLASENESAYKVTVDDIYSEVRNTIKENITVAEGKKLKITIQNIAQHYIPISCTSPLNVEFTTKNIKKRNNTVKVSCDMSNTKYPWQIYLPVNIEFLVPIIVAAKQLNTGETMTNNMLKTKWVNDYQLKGDEYQLAAALIGSKLHRRAPKNMPILKRQLCFVCKKDTIVITISTNNLQIKTQAIAIENGVIGQQIKLINTRTKNKLNAIVTGVMEAEVIM